MMWTRVRRRRAVSELVSTSSRLKTAHRTCGGGGVGWRAVLPSGAELADLITDVAEPVAQLISISCTPQAVHYCAASGWSSPAPTSPTCSAPTLLARKGADMQWCSHWRQGSAVGSDLRRCCAMRAAPPEPSSTLPCGLVFGRPVCNSVERV